MQRIVTASLAVLFCLTAACGGGSGGGVVGGSSLDAGFVADQPSPGANTVSAGQGATTNDLVTVLVNVTNTNGIYAAVFDLTFDSGHASYVGWTPGTLFEQGGNSVLYYVQQPQAGHIVVSASRQGNVASANVSGTRPVIGLTFRIENAGSSPIAYQANTLLDGQQQPQPISGINWFAGTLTGTEP